MSLKFNKINVSIKYKKSLPIIPFHHYKVLSVCMFDLNIKYF